MDCERYQELMSDYIDGELELGEQTRIELHLADCEPCRAVRDDLLQIVHFSRQLPLHTPSHQVWQRIEAQVNAEHRQGLGGRLSGWWRKMSYRRMQLSLPQMAVAASAMMVIAAGAVLWVRSPVMAPAPTSLATQQFVAAERQPQLLSNPEISQIETRIDELKRDVEQRKVAWNPELRVAFERNMLQVDQSLAECRRQVSSNPADDVSRELMWNAYREKVRVLEGFSKF